jgi:hypothetical protein
MSPQGGLTRFGGEGAAGPTPIIANLGRTGFKLPSGPSLWAVTSGLPTIHPESPHFLRRNAARESAIRHKPDMTLKGLPVGRPIFSLRVDIFLSSVPIRFEVHFYSFSSSSSSA